ncbi:hypothetical protein [Streptacidiphilus sp. PAMC 29251]
MSIRTTIPRVASTALIAVLLALPATGARAAEDPSSAPTPGASAPAPPSPSPSDSASPTASPTDAPTGSPTPPSSASTGPSSPASPTDAPSTDPSASASASTTPEPTSTPTPTSLPIATHAAETPWATSGQNGYPDHGRVAVWAWVQGATPGSLSTSAEITAITMHFALHGAPAGTPEAGTQSDFGTKRTENGSWVVSTDTKLPQLGLYDLSAELTDSNGNHVLVPDVGQFEYYPVLTVLSRSASPSTIDFDHHTVAITGKVSLVDPRDGSSLPTAGTALTLTDDYFSSSGSIVATVDADGDYTADTVVDQANADFHAVAASCPTTAFPCYLAPDQQPETAVNAVTEPTRIRMLTPTTLYGPLHGSVTFAGIVEHLSGSTWLPTPGMHINDTGGPEGYTQKVATTGADGIFHFSTSTTSSHSFDDYYNFSPFLDSGSSGPTVQAHVVAASSIASFKVTEDVYADALISGRITAATGTPGGLVDVQYSADNRHWSRVGTVKEPYGDLGITAYNGTHAGWWRVYYRGTSDFAPVYSKSVHIARTVTRITGGRPSTAHPRRNQYEAFSGSLQQYGHSWTGMAHAKVGLFFRPTGSKTWYQMATTRTDAHGRYSLRAKDPEGGTWCVADIWPDATHLIADGPAVWVGVH